MDGRQGGHTAGMDVPEKR